MPDKSGKMCTHEILGTSIIGSRRGVSTGTTFHAFEPRTGQTLAPDFFYAPADEMETAVRLAHEAFATYGHLPGAAKAFFLRAIATRIESVAEELIERAERETRSRKLDCKARPRVRADNFVCLRKSQKKVPWVNARIDRPDPDRKPLPKPDVRSMLRPLGPVVVFAPSNFPLAFSVAGGDTASALAAGNPVIVKGHGAHPGTSEIVGQVIQNAFGNVGCRREFSPCSSAKAPKLDRRW